MMPLDPNTKIIGILTPLFALRGTLDLGIGDTAALSEMIRWASEQGFHAIQILPINETGGNHSPYNVLSAMALEPSTITTHPTWIPELTVNDYRKVTARYDLQKLRTGEINYSEVKQLKKELLTAAWLRFRERDQRLGRSQLFKNFQEEEREWLPNYTLYRALLEHYQEFDFIWTSPPCQSHTSMNIANSLSPYEEDKERVEKQKANGGGIKPRYPKMELYQEIIFLTHFFKGKWVVENVIGYYEPLIKPNVIAKHYFWTNFILRDFVGEGRGMGKGETIKGQEENKGFDLSKYKRINKRLLLRNCVEPSLGKHILDLAINPINLQKSIF